MSRAPISIDAWGVKAQITPSGQAPEPPKNPWDILRRVISALGRITVGVFETTADLIEGIGSAARSGAVPPIVGEQIDNGRVQAEMLEGEKQAALEEGDQKALPNADEAVERIEAILEKVRARGDAAMIGQLPDGRLGIIAVPMELEEAAIAAISGPQGADQITEAASRSSTSASANVSED